MTWVMVLFCVFIGYTVSGDGGSVVTELEKDSGGCPLPLLATVPGTLGVILHRTLRVVQVHYIIMRGSECSPPRGLVASV
jgi:hypothetical protein